jgi:hypothetical protein
MSRRCHVRLPLAALWGGLALGTAVGVVGTAAAQAPSYSEWRYVEAAPETAEFRKRLGDGVFEEASKTLLTKSILPQLALPKNRTAIDNVRRRLREAICSDPGGEAGTVAAVQKMLDTTAEYLVALARDGNADPVVRVNAMMLLGELQIRGRRPWPGAVPPLVAAVSDESLPTGVRIAALNGLATHAEADAGSAAAIRPAVLAIIAGPRGPDNDVGLDWMRTRALSMLPTVAETAAPDTAAAVVKIVEDAKAPLDLRTRAADVLSRMARAESRVDVAKVVSAIAGIAGDTLAVEKERIDRLRVADLLSGGSGEYGAGMEMDYGPGSGMGMMMGGPPMGGPPPFMSGPQAGPGGRPTGRPPRRSSRRAAMLEETLMEPMAETGMMEAVRPRSQAELAIRRTAWRLDTLGRALVGDGTTSGLSALAGSAEDAARDLGQRLRDAAQKIAAEPVEYVVLDVVDAFAAGAAGKDQETAPNAATPAGDRAAAAADPFAEPQ